MTPFRHACIAFFFCSTPGITQIIAEEPAPVVTSIDGGQLYQARRVLRSFFANERHPECYRVLLSENAGNLRIDFVPKTLSSTVEEGDEQLITRRELCGRNVGYIISPAGRILRRVYTR